MSVGELVAFADRALDGLAHRRFDVDDVTVADALRAGFAAYRVEDAAARVDAPRGSHPVRAVRSRSARSPTTRCTSCASPGTGRTSPTRTRAGTTRRRGRSRCFERSASSPCNEGDRPVAFAQLEQIADSAEITQVYVHPDHRGGGRGTAMTRAAIEAAGDVRDLWIVADDEDRPKELYARLGFRTAWTAMELTRWPARAG